MKKADEPDNQNVNETVEQCYETGHLHEVTQRTMEILDASHKKQTCVTSRQNALVFSRKKELLCLNCHFVMKICLMVL
jgi:hypothetical protein